MAIEGQFPKVDGDILFASEANLLRPIMEVYTGSGFDSTTGVGTDEQSQELTVVTSTECKSAKYTKIKITGIGIANITNDTSSSNNTNELKAQIKEVGGAYNDIVAYSVFNRININGSSGGIPGNTITATYELVYELTAGMINNGFQIKVFSKSIASTSGSASFTNIQTVVELV